MDLSQIGVIGTSKKEDERRVPIHPEHLLRFASAISSSFLKRDMVNPSILKMMKSPSKREEWLQDQRYYQI